MKNSDHVPEVDVRVMVNTGARPRRNMGAWIAREELPSTRAYAYSMLMHGRIAGVLMKKSDWGNDDCLAEYRPTVLRRCVCPTLIKNMPKMRLNDSKTTMY